MLPMDTSGQSVGVSVEESLGSLELLPHELDRSRLSAPVRRALEHILQHYWTGVTVQEMADLSGRTPFQLIRAFRRELDMTPHAFLIRVRVMRATAMLRCGEPIAGVAVDVGFVDQTHFARHFKRFHGRTPGQYLKRRAHVVEICDNA